MAKYHYSTITENKEDCHAQEGNCDYENHFDNIEEARAFTQETLAKKYGVLPKLTKEDTKSQERITAALTELSEVNHITDLGRLTHAIEMESGNILQGKIIESTKLDGNTLNTVVMLTLEDGSVGYWKPVRLGSNGMLKVPPQQEVINEVAAYKFAQGLGVGFSHLVPETSIREHEGRIGSIQREAIGNVASARGEKKPKVSDFHYMNCALFDYIIGNGDRHSGNYIDVSPPDEYRLIDNGLAFNPLRGADHLRFGYETVKTYNKEENAYIVGICEQIQASNDIFGVQPYIGDQATKELQGRVAHLKAIAEKASQQTENIWDDDSLWA